MDVDLRLDGEIECRLCHQKRLIQSLDDLTNAYMEGWRGWSLDTAVFMVCKDCRAHRLFSLNSTFEAIINKTLKEIKE